MNYRCDDEEIDIPFEERKRRKRRRMNFDKGK
jgi:hypothetical protein